MIINKKVGITSYGVAIPNQIITTRIIEESQGKSGMKIGKSLGVTSKTVPARDEDTITLATDAGLNALSSFHRNKLEISNLFIGSESHPYAVKPSGTVVKDALGLSEDMALADLQFACKAGTQGLQIGFNYLLSGFSDYSLAIGADTAQAKPGDALEFTAGAGAAAYILGKEDTIADLKATISIATDTPDFWRRAGQSYPEHAGRFSGEPAYFYHIITAAKKIMNETSLLAEDFAYCVFHTPNGKFPRLAAKKLGFTPEQLEPSLVVDTIGNTYAGAVSLALSAVLDKAKPKEKILVVSYGSGAGSDAFVFETTDLITEYNKGRKGKIRDQIKLLKEVDYQEYRSVMDLLTH
ncbi:MAG: hydroxymethylglutaryl-CoA synthase [Candidatus Pacebacteria bacterium]|nr:hydroxymethylglutaryl-CoA synthase [Candidatus Paceibacterota bacterium]